MDAVVREPDVASFPTCLDRRKDTDGTAAGFGFACAAPGALVWAGPLCRS